MNLLLATDGSSDAKAALGFVKEVRFPPGSQLTILHVVRGSVSQAEPLWATYRTQQAKWLKLSQELQTIRRREGRLLLQQARLALTDLGLKITERLAFGNGAQEILKTAKQSRTDLIIMGLRGLTGIKRLLLGSVSDHVVHSAECSVAIIRHNHERKAVRPSTRKEQREQECCEE